MTDMLDIKNNLIYWFLCTKLTLYKWLKYIRCKLIKISEVKILSNNELSYVTCRFMFIKILMYIESLIKNLINKLDQDIDKARVIQNYEDNQKTIIIDKTNLSISTLVKMLNDSEYNIELKNTMNKTIYMNFEITCPENGIINMKDYLVKYHDPNKDHGHTSANILIFDEKQINNDATVFIKSFSSGKMVQKTVSFNEMKDNHLTEI
jgi:hypothetical protein